MEEKIFTVTSFVFKRIILLKCWQGKIIIVFFPPHLVLAALAEASIIIREHTPATNLFMCCWFNEMVRFTSRDQLSFVHVLRRLGIVHPKFFTTCMRKAMVNKLGHMRKASRLEGHGEK